MAGRDYRITVGGEISDRMIRAFQGMTLTRTGGNTELIGHVRDQSELLGILQRVSALGLTLISAGPVDDHPCDDT
jgi:hypothetical protein